MISIFFDFRLQTTIHAMKNPKFLSNDIERNSNYTFENHEYLIPCPRVFSIMIFVSQEATNSTDVNTRIPRCLASAEDGPYYLAGSLRSNLTTRDLRVRRPVNIV